MQGMCDLLAPLLVILDDGESTTMSHCTEPFPDTLFTLGMLLLVKEVDDEQ